MKLKIFISTYDWTTGTEGTGPDFYVTSYPYQIPLDKDKGEQRYELVVEVPDRIGKAIEQSLVEVSGAALQEGK